MCGFPRNDSDDDSELDTDDNKITESDVLWALEHQGAILEKSETELAGNKELSIHRLLQSIHRLDYQCLNKTLQWKGNLEEHTGYYHPMDLMHFLIKNLDILSRGKLYQKLSLCKLAVPVLFRNKEDVYMDASLRHVKTGWIKAGQTVEGNVTNAPVAILSMIRCGQQATKNVSKSKLANDLFNFKRDPILGSCGFFSRDSFSSIDSRNLAEGTVDGIWYEGTSRSDDNKFPESFGLLNLRGDALQNKETAATVASTSDMVFMFCGGDMFENDRYKIFFQEINKKLNLKGDGEKKIKELVVIFPKDAYHQVKKNHALFEDICKHVVWKKICDKYQKLLVSISTRVKTYLKEMGKSAISTLNERLRSENKESNEEDNIINRTKYINHSLLTMMEKIKNADEDQRSVLRR